MEVQDRTITFKNKLEPATNYDFYLEEKEMTKDEMGNTAQYLKFVNESIKDKKNRLDQLNEKQRKFEEEIQALQIGPKSKEQLDNLKYKDIKPEDIERTIQFLEKEREEIRKKMEYHATQVSHAKLDIIEKDKEIAKIKAEWEIAKKREQNYNERLEKELDPIEIIKNKVQKLGNTEDTQKILMAVDMLAAKLKSNSNSEVSDLDETLSSLLTKK